MSSTALQISPLRLQPTTLPPGPGRPSRPRLRVLLGGQAPARLAQQAVYRRRRLVAAVLAVAVLAAAVFLASAAVARIAGGAPSAAGVPSSAAGVAAPATVVVEPGDTLWSIAAAVAPAIDVRITVDRLVTLNGSSPIVVGQQLELP